MTSSDTDERSAALSRGRVALVLAIVMAPALVWAQMNLTPVSPNPSVSAAAARAVSELESSHWIADGKAGAPRIVYVFTDPNCPYCNKFWSDARPWVDAGKVQLRHVIVGILTPTSAGKAAALLDAKNPSVAFDAYERRNAFGAAHTIGSGHPRPLNDPSLAPMVDIPASLQGAIAANERLMSGLRLGATPAFAWLDAAGVLQTRTGIPEGALAKMLGPL